MMELGVNSLENGRVAGIALEFPATDGATSSSPPRIPPRLRRRLSETKASPSSVEEIEAKLRDADLRRQKFYENLSTKARPKPRSPISLPHEDDLGQRLEAKLQAAEQKRLSILAKAQMRLAKLDELRQAVKNGVELRFKKQRAELGTKVESRVQQAETNRLLILKAYKQRRATMKERTSQSLLQRISRESKYKECVRTAIYQKWAAAEKKRLGLLEAERKRAHARVLQVRKVAKSVSHQREIERRKLKDKLEDKLQRARRLRAEYLRQRGRPQIYVSPHWYLMHKQADLLSRKLARCWRRFLEQRKTSLELAKAYDSLNINKICMDSMPFELLARLIESPGTLQATKALLDRFESRYKVSRALAVIPSPSSWDDIDHLLKRVASPSRRMTPRRSIQSKDSKKQVWSREAFKSPVKLPRYQVRVVLCAYMILGHPDAVFSGQGERETVLARAAEKFVQEFELLVKIILNGPMESSSDEKSNLELERRWTFRPQLAAFDAAWCSYLNCFVAWKDKDAQSLEDDLVRAACQLELSMIQTCRLTPEGDGGALTHDMKAIQKQVTDDLKLLKAKVHHLSGDPGIERMKCALSDTRARYFQARENGSPVGSPITHIPSSAADASFASSDKMTHAIENSERPRHVVRSLFKDDASPSLKEVRVSTSQDNQFCYSGENLEIENELIVNEVVHGQHTFADGTAADEELNKIKAEVKETMEKAFWDGMMDSMKQDEPNYDRIVELMREVRDEISEMAPQSWKQEIFEAIDMDIISQVLNSGEIDMYYLGKILGFAMSTLRKLSAPAAEDELKEVHQKLLKELTEMCQDRNMSNDSNAIALIRGLRFVLEQIQVLKQEISKARMRMLQPFLKGTTGLDYLRTAFSKRYGPPSDALASLPLTKNWLSSVLSTKDQEWGEHKNALSEITKTQERLSPRVLPATTMRTGGSFLAKMSGLTSAALDPGAYDQLLPGCSGEKVDFFVRLGLLKLVTEVSGLTQEELPETLKLNLLRLGAVQAQVQKMIVISTSILVLRQVLITEHIVITAADIESMVLSCVKQLSELVDNSKNAGLKHIIDVLTRVVEASGKCLDSMKLQQRKDLMAQMLTKCLQAGDAVFVRVSRAIYLAMRGIVLGGSGNGGRELSEMALRQVGAAVLVNMVEEAAKVLVLVATVTSSVHGSWYAQMLGNS